VAECHAGKTIIAKRAVVNTLVSLGAYWPQGGSTEHRALTRQECPEGYIDLERRFRDFSDAESPEDAFVRGYLATAKGAGAGFGWKEVLATRVVVVLGEPGSGKTWELRCQTDAVRKGGGVAFFVRLDRLVDATLQNVISPDDEVSFRRWLGTPAQPAHFLLDSVDEAKLRRHESFGVALDNFVRDLPVPARHRASLVISSRISEWRPDTDRFELQRHLDLFMLSRTRDASGWEEEPDDIRIVELEPLDRRRVRLFAEKRGLERPDDFVEALDTHHAWDFAGRPIDVAALIDYWREHGRLGSLTELIADDLARKPPICCCVTAIRNACRPCTSASFCKRWWTATAHATGRLSMWTRRPWRASPTRCWPPISSPY
jgi:hypothetical protein